MLIVHFFLHVGSQGSLPGTTIISQNFRRHKGACRVNNHPQLRTRNSGDLKGRINSNGNFLASVLSGCMSQCEKNPNTTYAVIRNGLVPLNIVYRKWMSRIIETNRLKNFGRQIVLYQERNAAPRGSGLKTDFTIGQFVNFTWILMTTLALKSTGGVLTDPAKSAEIIGGGDCAKRLLNAVAAAPSTPSLTAVNGLMG